MTSPPVRDNYTGTWQETPEVLSLPAKNVDPVAVTNIGLLTRLKRRIFVSAFVARLFIWPATLRPVSNWRHGFNLVCYASSKWRLWLCGVNRSFISGSILTWDAENWLTSEGFSRQHRRHLFSATLFWQHAIATSSECQLGCSISLLLIHLQPEFAYKDLIT